LLAETTWLAWTTAALSGRFAARSVIASTRFRAEPGDTAAGLTGSAESIT